MQSKNAQIRLINHKNNLGIYESRVDAIKNAKGNYIIFLDPDDLFSNQNLLKDLYQYNLIYNEDILEFLVMVNEESNNRLYYPWSHRWNHYHIFNEKIIHYPYLSDFLFFDKNKYSDVFCRCIWNKMIRKEVLYKTINFIGKEKKHFNFAEDTIINILNFQFAYNYSNLNLIGYMYNIREESMSHSNKGKAADIKMSQNILYFYNLFYKYIKHFNKDLNYLYFDLKAFDYYFNYIKEYNCSYSNKKPIIQFYEKLFREKNISREFRQYTKNFIYHFEN